MFFELPLKACNEGDPKTFLIPVLWVSISPLNIQPKYFLITFSLLLGPVWQMRVLQYLHHMCFAEEEAHTQGWCLKAFTDLSLQTGHPSSRLEYTGNAEQGHFKGRWTRCPLKQRDRTDWASALPSLPFWWDSSCVLGFNVSQGLCQQRLEHRNSQWVREISKSYRFSSKAQAAALQFLFSVLHPTMTPFRTVPVNWEGFLCIHGPMPMLFNN